MIKRKYLGYFIGLFIFAIIVSVVTSNMIESNTPEFILNKYEELKGDKVLIDSIGGFKSFEYTFNKNEYKFGDNLSYSIIIFGKDKNINFKGVQSKNQEGEWELVKGEMSIE